MLVGLHGQWASCLPQTSESENWNLGWEQGLRMQQRETEEGKGWGGEREQDSHVLLRLRGALASGDQLASITDFI